MVAQILTGFAETRSHKVVSAILRSLLVRELLAGAFWAIVGSCISQGMTFVAVIVLARTLGAKGYGELGIVVSTATVFATFAAMGLGVTATKHVAEYRVLDPARAGRMIGLALGVSALGGLVVAILLLVFAPFLCDHILGAPYLRTEVRISSLMMVMFAINGGQLGALSGFKAFKSIAKASLIRGFLVVPVLFFCANRLGRRGAVIGYCILGLVDLLVYHKVLKSTCRTAGISLSYRLTSNDMQTLLSFCLPVLVAGLSFTPAVWAANALHANRSGYAQMGIFAAAFQWHAIILFLSNAVSQIGLPMLTGIQAEGNHRQYLKCFGAIMFLTYVPAVIVAVPVACFSGQIMSLYGPAYRQGAGCLAVLCLSATLSALNSPVGQAIWSLNAAVAGMLFALLRAAVLTVAAYWLTPSGALGLAAAYAGMATVLTVAQAPYLYGILKRQARSIVCD